MIGVARAWSGEDWPNHAWRDRSSKKHTTFECHPILITSHRLHRSQEQFVVTTVFTLEGTSYNDTTLL